MEGESGELLAELESFVTDCVAFDEGDSETRSLAQRLDVLGRIIELLRLQAGEIGNRLSMKELLETGLGVARDTTGTPRIRVGTMFGKPFDPSEERAESELQIPLLLFLLQDYRKSRRIRDTLAEFFQAVHSCLSPKDVETTQTGVTRIVTTTRGAARTLYDHGLLSRSQQTEFKRWELSILGILTAAVLFKNGNRLELPRRYRKPNSAGPFGAEGRLVKGIADILTAFENPSVVAAALMELCTPNMEVFPSFDTAVELVTSYSRSLVSESVRAEGTPYEQVSRRLIDAMEKRKAARRLIDALDEVVPRTALREDFAKAFALEELLGQPT